MTLRALAAAALVALPAWAEPVKLVTWDVGLVRSGPGLLLRDLGREDAQVEAVVQGIRHLDADVLVLVGVDYDASGAALAALQARLASAGADYPAALALRPNAGVPTGLDLDGDGTAGGPRDAQGYGRFAGQGGIAVLSRLPLRAEALRDFSSFLWRDLPGADLPEGMTPEAAAVQRLATTGFYDLPVAAPGGDLHLLIYAATPPVFDGPEDRNGRRNADETAFWAHLLAGDLPMAPPDGPYVILGQPNLDPEDGDGRPEALRALLGGGRVQDALPRGQSGHVDPGHRGDPALDTMRLKDGSGLRLDMILPQAGLRVTDAGVLWPAPGDALAPVMEAASDHRAVWVTIDLP